MNDALKVMKLQLAKRGQTLVPTVAVPLGVSAVILTVFAILMSSLPAGEVQRAASSGAGIHQAVFWGLFGFGVVSMATSYPIARALGASRSGYTLGTLAYFLVVAVMVVVLMAVLYLVEVATNHWFIGVHLTDTPILGGGGLVALAALALPGALFASCFGAVFGAVWLRFGTIGPWVAGFIVVVLASAGVIVFVLNIGTLGPWLTTWTIALAFALGVVVATLANRGIMRDVSVRGS